MKIVTRRRCAPLFGPLIYPELHGQYSRDGDRRSHDRFDPVAERFAVHLRDQGFITALNEPYSGKDGQIFSAQHHGHRHGVIYLELEIRQDLIDTPDKVTDVSSRLCDALTELQIRSRNR